MTKNSLDIEVVIGADVSGGVFAKQALENVKQSAQGTGDVVRHIGDESVPSIHKLSSGLQGVNIAAIGAKQGIEGIGTVVHGLTKTFESVFGQTLTNMSTWAGALGIAFAAGWKGGSIIYKAIVEPIFKAYEDAVSAGDIWVIRAKEQQDAIAKDKVTFTGLKKGIDDALKDIDRLKTEMAKIDEDAEAQKKLASGRNQIAAVGSQISEKRDLLSVTDPAAQEAIKQIYEEQRKRAVLEQEATTIAVELNTKQKKLDKLMAARVKLEQKINDLQEEESAIWANPDAVAKEKLRAKSITREIESTSGKTETINKTIDGLILAVNELKLSADLLAKNRELAGLEMGEASAKNLSALGDAVSAQRGRVSAARSSLGQAQTTGAPDQGEAYNNLRAEEEALRKLEALMQTAKNQVTASGKEFGDAYTEAARKTLESAATAKTDIETSTKNIVKSVEDAANDVSGGTSKFSDAVDSSSGKIVQAYTDSADKIIVGLDNWGAKVKAKLDALEAIISLQNQQIQSANSNATLALSQIKNMR